MSKPFPDEPRITVEEAKEILNKGFCLGRPKGRHYVLEHVISIYDDNQRLRVENAMLRAKLNRMNHFGV